MARPKATRSEWVLMSVVIAAALGVGATFAITNAVQSSQQDQTECLMFHDMIGDTSEQASDACR